VSKSVPSQTNATILKAHRFEKFPWLIHGFSTRRGGSSRVYGGRSLNLGFTTHDSKRSVQRNRSLFLEELGISRASAITLVTLRQIHSDLIRRVPEDVSSALVGDGLVSDVSGFLLGIQTADCLPVMVVDRRIRAVGVFHAGWRGTVKRIVEKGVGEMRRLFGSRASDLEAAIGPGIHSCCYSVGEQVREDFHSQFGYARVLFHEVRESDPVRQKYPMLFLTARAPGHSILPVKTFLDLVQANRRQLLDAGVRPKSIEVSALCTSCNTELLFSHRAEKGVTGRMMAVVGLRAEGHAKKFS
jgi:YfiH family protein